jgi:3-oxoacyl-[acyl-carrier-protein] synthase III
MALSETVRAGLVKPEDLIIFVAFGGGLSWGAVAWRWVA